MRATSAHCSSLKASPGGSATAQCHTHPAGWTANLGHVTTYSLTLAVALAVVGWRFQLGYAPGWVAAGLALNAVTHAWADRRAPLRALAVAIGKKSYWDEVPGGAWHAGRGGTVNRGQCHIL
ncbi:hypothetical protein [Streptosporangium roseum]|uniref:hypothetical protein n=1 Tax=Streptosporangium roseum TaxID=2001 RepID=UPI00332F50C2